MIHGKIMSGTMDGILNGKTMKFFRNGTMISGGKKTKPRKMETMATISCGKTMKTLQNMMMNKKMSQGGIHLMKIKYLLKEVVMTGEIGLIVG